MIHRLPFTKSLYDFLVRRGYTHIQLRGLAPKEAIALFSSKMNNDDYVLVPWKEGLASFEDANWVEHISSAEVKDMLDAPDGIHFFIELPAEITSEYKSSI